jgi:hypothetical protein
MNLNNPRLTQYINVVKLVDNESVFKLEVQNKAFKETKDAYQFNMNVRSQGTRLENKTSYRCWLLIDRSMFYMMHFAIDNVNKFFLFPKLDAYNIDIQENLDLNLGGDEGFPLDLTKKQKQLIRRILSVKTGEFTPPVS